MGVEVLGGVGAAGMRGRPPLPRATMTSTFSTRASSGDAEGGGDRYEVVVHFMTDIQVDVLTVGRWRNPWQWCRGVPWQALDDQVPTAANPVTEEEEVNSQGGTSCGTGVLQRGRSAVVGPCSDERLPACRSARVLLLSGNSQARRTGM